MSGPDSSDSGGENRDEVDLVTESLVDSSELELDQANGLELTGEIAIEVSEAKHTAFWGMAKKAIGDASTRVSTTGVAIASKAASLGSSGVTKAAELGKQTFVAAGNVADASGATQAIRATAGAVAGKLDEVSGKRLVELLEQKLRIQDSYNDILATRLAEALQRVSIVEARLNELTSRSPASPNVRAGDRG